MKLWKRPLALPEDGGMEEEKEEVDALSPSAGLTQNSLRVRPLLCELFGSFLQDITNLTSRTNSKQLEISMFSHVLFGNILIF